MVKVTIQALITCGLVMLSFDYHDFIERIYYEQQNWACKIKSTRFFVHSLFTSNAHAHTALACALHACMRGRASRIACVHAQVVFVARSAWMDGCSCVRVVEWSGAGWSSDSW